jgi:tRNA(adenine34) deaminase
MSLTDTDYMQLALAAAAEAQTRGEVPVGSVVVINEQVVAVGYNERELAHDPTAHAELLAMRRAAQALGHWRLCDADVYVTLEPCPMCAGAMVNARVKRVIYGCDDPKAGAVRSLYQLLEDPRLNHRVQVVSGVLADESSAMLKSFFANLRAKRASVTEPLPDP